MKRKGKGGGRRGQRDSATLTHCKHNEDIQPVGGRIQATFRDKMTKKREEFKKTTADGQPSTADKHVPLAISVYHEDYASSLNVQGEPGTRQAQQNIMYQPPPYESDPEKRKMLYMYRSSEITGPNMPYIPMTLQQ